MAIRTETTEPPPTTSINAARRSQLFPLLRRLAVATPGSNTAGAQISWNPSAPLALVAALIASGTIINQTSP